MLRINLLIGKTAAEKNSAILVVLAYWKLKIFSIRQP